MESQPGLIALAMAAAIFACSASSRAAASPVTAFEGVAGATAMTAPFEPSVPNGPGAAQIGEAVRCLEQATLQSDFSSNADELALLREAQDHLAQSELQRADFALASFDLHSWPPEMPVRWPQIHFRF